MGWRSAIILSAGAHNDLVAAGRTRVVIRHLSIIVATTLLIAGCMFYPYLPGDYDGLAVTLSVMAQLFAMAGLLLVPLGVIWLLYELASLAAKGEGPRRKKLAYWFGMASLCIATLVAIVVAMGATVDHHLSLALVVLALWAFCACRLAARLKVLRNAAERTFNPAPLYLIVLPVVAAILKFTLVVPASEFSRNWAIDESANLIREIERYREAHGHYPRSLQSLWDDYRPSVVGIKRYNYEPNGDDYNLYFEHFAVALDMKEIVMYNKRDEQDFSSHNTDLLTLSPAQITAQRGYVFARGAARPHWKYFLFD
jgi:hypothetical protein